MTKKINVFEVNAEKHDFGSRVIGKDLNSYYKAIGCRLIDIQSRKVGKKWYDFIIDDEGLFSEAPVPTAFNEDGTPFVGTILVAGAADDEGELTDLTDDDVQNLNNHIRFCVSPEGIIPVLVGLKY